MTVNTKVALTLSNSIIGVSILAMPFCMKQCGIVLGILMLLLSSLLTRFTCHLLLKSAHVSRRKTFEYVALHAFGPIGKLVVELNIIGFMLGILISFFVVIGDLGPAIISHALNIQNTELLRSVFLIFVGLAVALPVAMLKDVGSLAQISTLSILFYMILSLNAVVEALPVLLSGKWVQHIHWWEPVGILHSLPIFALAMSCQTQIFEIYDTLPDPSLKHMNAVVKLAVYICAALYFMVGFFGYVANHEENFSGNILLSSSPGFVTEVIKLLFVLSVALSFPLVVLPCRTSIHSLLFKRSNVVFEVGGNYISDERFKGITTVIVISTLIIGLLCPNIEMVLGFIGSTIGIFICVIFPTIIFIHLTTKSTFEKWGAQFVFIIGIILLLSCTWVSFDPLIVADEKLPISVGNLVPVAPKDYLPELQLDADVNSVNSYEDKNAHTSNRKETISLVLRTITTYPKPAEPPVPEEKKIHLKAEIEYQNPAGVKIDIKRQEPPVPQEPEENLNRETGSQRMKMKTENKHQADIQVSNSKDAFENDEKELVGKQTQQEIKAKNSDKTFIKQEELLKKMELQQEEQKKILEVQREILKELKAHGQSHGGIIESGKVEARDIYNKNSIDKIKQQKALIASEILIQDTENIGNQKEGSLKEEKLQLSPVTLPSNSIKVEKMVHDEVLASGNAEGLSLMKSNSLKVGSTVKKQEIIRLSPGGLVNAASDIANDKVAKLKNKEMDVVHVVVSIPKQPLNSIVSMVRAQTETSRVVQSLHQINDVNAETISDLKKPKENVPQPIKSLERSIRSSAIEGIPFAANEEVGQLDLHKLQFPNFLQIKDEGSDGKHIGRDLKFSV